MNTAIIPGKLVEFYANTIPFKSSVILLSGKAGTGKSTASSILESIFHEYGLTTWRVSFAKGVKDAAWEYFNWNGQKDDRGRKLLQSIGNTGRQYDPDTWVRYVFGHLLNEYMNENYLDPDVTIVDDWRFPNEAAFIENLDGYVVYKLKLVAPERELLKNTPYYNDISEISLDGYTDFDACMDNSGTMDDLYQQLLKFVQVYYRKELNQ